MRDDGGMVSGRRRAAAGAGALAAVATAVTACSPPQGPGLLRAEVGEPGDPDAYVCDPHPGMTARFTVT